MRIFILILVNCFLIIGCNKDDDSDSISSTNGTVLISAERLNEGSNTYSEIFDYDNSGVLSNVQSFYENSENSGYNYTLNYIDNQLQTIDRIKIEDQTLFSKDSLSYDDNGRLEKIFLINRQGGDELDVFYTYEFAYDDENRIVSETTIGDFFIWKDSFHWEGNNIVQKDQFGEDGLMHSFFYIYDDKINPKRDLPYYFKQPIFQSQNNVIEESAIDFTGILDLYCNPCKHEYKYNLDNVPVEIQYEWGRTIKFTYQ